MVPPSFMTKASAPATVGVVTVAPPSMMLSSAAVAVTAVPLILRPDGPAEIPEP